MYIPILGSINPPVTVMSTHVPEATKDTQMSFAGDAILSPLQVDIEEYGLSATAPMLESEKTSGVPIPDGHGAGSIKVPRCNAPEQASLGNCAKV